MIFKMSFERSDQLMPILDHLERSAPKMFKNALHHAIAVQRRAAPGHRVLRPAAGALLDELEKLAAQTFGTVERVLTHAYIEDFDSLEDALKEQWVLRLHRMSQAANSEYDQSVRSWRDSGIMLPGQPKDIFLKYIEEIKPKWFAEIELFCKKLHDLQVPRLFLKAGEVFGGNRATRAIFTAARESLDVVDTNFGPQVFDMLELVNPPVRIRMISDKAESAITLAYNLFKQQFGRGEFRTCDRQEIHDRFIMVDSKTVLHLNASITNLGNADSLIDAVELDPHKKRFEELWLNGRPVQ